MLATKSLEIFLIEYEDTLIVGGGVPSDKSKCELPDAEAGLTTAAVAALSEIQFFR